MIPLSVPYIQGNEWQYVKECLDTGWVSSAGAYVEKFEEAVKEYTKSRHAVACMNGTVALQIALVLSGVQRDSHVIIPDLTFVATANAVHYTGAELILLDVCRKTWQLDLDLFEDFLTSECERTSRGCVFKKTGKVITAVVPVHVVGMTCDMDRLVALAADHNIAVVEDSTEALGTKYKDRHAGTLADMGCLSFNGNKMITTGGGGMILTNSQEVASRAKHLTTTAKIDSLRYIHDEVGYNYRLVNVLAAIGVAQMENLEFILKSKLETANYYNEILSSIESIEFREAREYVAENNWLYTIRCRDMNALLHHLLDHGVQVRPLWMPMHRLPMYEQSHFITRSRSSDVLHQECLSLPCSAGITYQEREQVVKTITDFYLNQRSRG